MPSPAEHKTVQAHILAYEQEIGWTLVSRAETEQRLGFDAEERTRRASKRVAGAEVRADIPC